MEYAPTICIIIRPADVVVSMASVKLRKPVPDSPSRSMIVSYIADGARQPVQFPGHQHVTLAELIQKSVKFWPVPWKPADE